MPQKSPTTVADADDLDQAPQSLREAVGMTQLLPDPCLVAAAKFGPDEDNNWSPDEAAYQAFLFARRPDLRDPDEGPHALIEVVELAERRGWSAKELAYKVFRTASDLAEFRLQLGLMVVTALDEEGQEADDGTRS